MLSPRELRKPSMDLVTRSRQLRNFAMAARLNASAVFRVPRPRPSHPVSSKSSWLRAPDLNLRRLGMGTRQCPLSPRLGVPGHFAARCQAHS